MIRTAPATSTMPADARAGRCRRWLGGLALASAAMAAAEPPPLELVTTSAPYPRGLEVVDGRLYILCRGRVRGEGGGVTASVDDEAGTIYVVDPEDTATVRSGARGRRDNATVFARPTTPPFNLWDRTAAPPETDRRTDRPYCALRYDPATSSFYVCAFSGVDKPRTPADPIAFSKNGTDAILRYDLRTHRWYEVERHRVGAGGRYPHHDPARAAPPHGWLNGPDNCLAVGHGLYAVAKDNSRLVRYDLRSLRMDPEAGCPPSEVVLGDRVRVRGQGWQPFAGHSALSTRDGWLYVGSRTSSLVLRLPLDASGGVLPGAEAELVARFDPYDPATGHSANITDMDFDDEGRLYVISAEPARIYRFEPDGDRVFDARGGQATPWADLCALTGRARLKGENVRHHDRWLYVTTADAYGHADDEVGAVYRLRIDAAPPPG